MFRTVIVRFGVIELGAVGVDLHVPKTEVPALRDYIFSDKFKVAGFKGQQMTIRDWDQGPEIESLLGR